MSDLLPGIDGLRWKQLLASTWMATDGTGIKVIVPKPLQRTTAISNSIATTRLPYFNTSDLVLCPARP